MKTLRLPYGHWCRSVERYVARGALLALILASGSFLHAQSADVTAANRTLAQAFEVAWNTHDMTALGALLTADVDWINVGGYRGRGREPVVQGHARVHAGKFKDSVLTVQEVEVAVLAPTVALAHVRWHIRGDRNNDGTPREPREGIFTWVTVLEGDSWKIRASHNTNRDVIR